MGKILDFIYIYCTDFIINLANLTGLSYYEVNALLFCVGYPLMLAGAIGLFVVQSRRLKRLRSKV
jgi:hypothetical protein